MHKYQIKVDKKAIEDIKNSRDWYNNQSEGLGNKFAQHTKSQIEKLKTNPFIASVRYENVRCLYTKKFPFLIHYIVNEKANLVIILAVLHCSRNPEIWKIK